LCGDSFQVKETATHNNTITHYRIFWYSDSHPKISSINKARFSSLSEMNLPLQYPIGIQTRNLNSSKTSKLCHVLVLPQPQNKSLILDFNFCFLKISSSYHQAALHILNPSNKWQFSQERKDELRSPARQIYLQIAKKTLFSGNTIAHQTPLDINSQNSL